MAILIIITNNKDNKEYEIKYLPLSLCFYKS